MRIDDYLDHEIIKGQSGASHITDRGGEQSPSMTIDYLEDAKIPRVTLMKIDIEGYELTAVRGARRSLESRRIQTVYFEYLGKLVRVLLVQCLGL